MLWNFADVYSTVIAFLFPVDDTLHLPYEKEAHWIQHTLLLILPMYMICFESKAYPLFRTDILMNTILLNFFLIFVLPFLRIQKFERSKLETFFCAFKRIENKACR